MAARRTHVPKFGNWDANDHMPYTVVFDHARQGRGKPINPNDPTENPSMFPAGRGGGGGGGGPGARRHVNPNEPEESTDRAQQERQQQGIVREGSSGSGSGGGGGRGGAQQQQQQQQQISQQRASGAEERRRMSTGQVPSRGPSADLSKRPNRDSGLDRRDDSPGTSFADQSPSHPGQRFEGSAGGRGGATAGNRVGSNSPVVDQTRRRSTGEEGQMFAPATPNRSRLGNGKTNNATKEDAKGSAALPRFGAWDAQDPGSGDGFTVIFNNARNEKKTGGPVSLNPKTPDRENDLYDNSNSGGYHKKHSGQNSWFCCLSPKVKP
ncbi:unnamed protein product [Calypogeia fissa]